MCDSILSSCTGHALEPCSAGLMALSAQTLNEEQPEN